jgi:hypothetical protein
MRLAGTSNAPDSISELKDVKEIQLSKEREAVRFERVRREGLEVEVQLLKLALIAGTSFLALTIGIAVCSVMGLVHDPDSLHLSAIASGAWVAIAAILNRRLSRWE